MDIKILDSWLRTVLSTNAKPADIARCLSLCGPSIEKVEKIISAGKTDYIYSIEITSNRVDMMSIIGIAREASVILPQFGFNAKIKNIELDQGSVLAKTKLKMEFVPDPKLVYRIMGVVLEIDTLGESPSYIKDRLEASGIRSLNTVVDITNYVMMEVGHPTHVFDYDKVAPVIKVRESRKGEEITSFDENIHKLSGGDIVFENAKGEIIDLPGIIGTKNSVVSESTKRILFFIDTNDPLRIRKTSTRLGIRTNAAVLNEKGIDPNLADLALKRGLHLYKKLLKAKQISKVYDIYPKKQKPGVIKIKHEILQKRLGIEVDPIKVLKILRSLEIFTEFNRSSNEYSSTPPTFRSNDIKIQEDLIEEVARIYGYHNLPSKLMTGEIPEAPSSSLDFESKIKKILKGLGGVEVYTLSLVSKSQTGGKALKILNPLGKDGEYLRDNLKESLIAASRINNGQKDPFHLFEIANVYLRQNKALPKEEQHLVGIFSGHTYRRAKGLVESLMSELNIKYKLKSSDAAMFKTSHRIVFSTNSEIGEFGVLEDGDTILYDFVVDKLLKEYKEFSTFQKIAKYPAQIEDITLVLPAKTTVVEVIDFIRGQSTLITKAEIKDIYNDSFTFRINYQSEDRTLTDSEVLLVKEPLLKNLEKKFGATIK